MRVVFDVSVEPSARNQTTVILQSLVCNTSFLLWTTKEVVHLVRNVTRRLKMEIYHCWPFYHRPYMAIFRNLNKVKEEK